MAAWTASGDGYVNDDGLHIRFGTNKTNVGRAGEYNVLGPTHVTEIQLDLTDLNASTQTIISPTVTIPSGAQIEKVVVIVTEIPDSAADNANLDLGFIRYDRTTEYDYNGLLAAADAFHEGAVGLTTEYVSGTTEAGALVGTVLANDGILVAKADTAAFTTGALTIRIEWSMWVAAPNL